MQPASILAPLKILSVQSHVAYGHVGNAAAVFPLQRMGYDVWPLHTCLLSNHTGYVPVNGAAMRGEIFSPEVVASVVQALHERTALGHLSGVLSGWLGKAALGEAVAHAVRTARTEARALGRDGVLYLCDPVLGDEGDDGIERLYAAADIPEFIARVLLPLSDVITPNRFELALISGEPVTDRLSALSAARSLLRRGGQPGPWLVVVTSLPVPADPNAIGCLAVTAEAAWEVITPRLRFPVPLNGTGDCLAALLLGALLKGETPPQALGHAVSALFAILQITQSLGSGPAGRPELALIAAQHQIENPPRLYEVVEISERV